MNREGTVKRETRETAISVKLVLDGSGTAKADTGIPFFNHMIESLARFAGFDIEIEARGDLAVDGHHTVEDVGIVLGQAFARAIGNRSGIRRYGWAALPMDESLVLVSLDVSGRVYLGWEVPLEPRSFGYFHTELAEEFWRAFVNNAGLNLHVRLLAGTNAHHVLEAVWKGVGLSLGQAVSSADGLDGPLSTKGVLG